MNREIHSRLFIRPWGDEPRGLVNILLYGVIRSERCFPFGKAWATKSWEEREGHRKGEGQLDQLQRSQSWKEGS